MAATDYSRFLSYLSKTNLKLTFLFQRDQIQKIQKEKMDDNIRKLSSLKRKNLNYESTTENDATTNLSTVSSRKKLRRADSTSSSFSTIKTNEPSGTDINNLIDKLTKSQKCFKQEIGKSAFQNLIYFLKEKNQNLGNYFENNEHSRIIRGKWSQANPMIFNTEFAGRQCCAMALASVIKSQIMPPFQWNIDTICQNMFEGDELYKIVRSRSGGDIPESGFLCLKNFDVVKSDLKLFDCRFSVHYDNDPMFFGNLMDAHNDGVVGVTLLTALKQLFDKHSKGILIAGNKCFALMHSYNKYYFCDSHDCGPEGEPEEEGCFGQACVIQCDTVETLNYICKRATGEENEPFTLDHVDVTVIDDYIINRMFTTE